MVGSPCQRTFDYFFTALHLRGPRHGAPALPQPAVRPFTPSRPFICGGPDMAPAIPQAAVRLFTPSRPFICGGPDMAPALPQPAVRPFTPSRPFICGGPDMAPALPQPAVRPFTPSRPFICGGPDMAPALPQPADIPALPARSRDPGDGVDLDVDAFSWRGRPHRGAGRLDALEVFLEDAVEDGEVVHVAQIDPDPHHVGDRGAAGFEHRADIVEGHPRLLGDVLGHDALGDGVERALAGDEQKAAALDSLGDGRLGPLGESGLGRRLREDDLWLHGRDSPLRRATMRAGMGRAASAASAVFCAP